MARIFYSLAGEGRGHATRARAIVDALFQEHEITIFAPEMAYVLLSEAYEGTSVRVRRMSGLRFQYQGSRLSYAKSVAGSFAYLRRKPWMLRSLRRRIEQDRPDLCICDFEPLLPRAAKECHVPFISIDHQHFLAVSDFSDLPSSLRWKAELLGVFTKWFYRGQAMTVVSSFYSPKLKRGLKNVVQTGVMLRQAVLDAESTAGEHLLVYLRRFPHHGLLEALRKIGRPTIVYGLGDRPAEANLTFRQVQEQSFLDDLASCHALICNAGNQLVGEAFYLRKPVLAIPEAGNFEQYINAHYLTASGGGDWIEANRIHSAAITNFLNRAEECRARIIPNSVRGNDVALEVIRRHLPATREPATTEPQTVRRQPKRKHSNFVARAIGFSRAFIRHQFRRDDLPRFLTHTVTFSCNARCIMCDSWKIPSPNDLTIDEISDIYDELPTMDAVRLTGGEPFVRSDFPEIARLAQAKLKPLGMHITTNGFLTRRIVRYLEDRKRSIPMHVLVSIDGVEEKHNEVRGHSSAWKHAMETIRSLAPRQRELNIRLAVNQTIVDAEGVEHYKRLRDVLRPLGVRNNVVMAYDVSATYSTDRDIDVAPTEIGQFSTFGEFSDAHLNELIAEIEKDLNQFPFLDRLAKRYYLKGIANRLLHHEGMPNPHCVALTSHLRIFPNGDIPTCQFNSKSIGNLRHQSFAEIWKSASAHAQRTWVRQCAGCWAECEVLPSAIYTLDLLKESLKPRLSLPSVREPERVDVR